MQKANINDRDSLERLYPREAFQEDAGRNALGKTPVLYGVRIESAPDAQGWFHLVRAQQHVGEQVGVDTIFLAAEEQRFSAPLLGQEPAEASKGAALTPEATGRQDYETFITQLVDAARSAEFPQPVGRGEPRLKGFHGG
jgi:hypothetical protein